MQARGLIKDWDAPPPGEIEGGGLRWGMTRATADDGEVRLGAQLPLNVPDALGIQLARGCYWVSEPAVSQLKRWSLHWGDGPTVRLRDLGGAGPLGAMVAGMAPRATPEALEEKARLQAQVVSTGQVIRAAVNRVIATPPPDVV